MAEKSKMKEKVDLILKHNINCFINRWVWLNREVGGVYHTSLFRLDHQYPFKVDVLIGSGRHMEKNLNPIHKPLPTIARC